MLRKIHLINICLLPEKKKVEVFAYRYLVFAQVKVGPDVVLPADIRLQAHPSVDEFDNDDKRQEVPGVWQ